MIERVYKLRKKNEKCVMKQTCDLHIVFYELKWSTDSGEKNLGKVIGMDVSTEVWKKKKKLHTILINKVLVVPIKH